MFFKPLGILSALCSPVSLASLLCSLLPSVLTGQAGEQLFRRDRHEAVSGAGSAQQKSSHLEKSSRAVGCDNKTAQGSRRKERIKATRFLSR